MPGAGESRLWEWRYWGWRTAAIVLWERGQGATLRGLATDHLWLLHFVSPSRTRAVFSCPTPTRPPFLAPSRIPPLPVPSLCTLPAPTHLPPSLPSLPASRPQRGRRSLTKYFRRPRIITRRGPPAPASPAQDPRHRHLLSNPRTPVDSYSFPAVPVSTGPSFAPVFGSSPRHRLAPQPAPAPPDRSLRGPTSSPHCQHASQPPSCPV